LERVIYEFLDTHNADPKPFVWAKSADEILASIARLGAIYSPQSRLGPPSGFD
jgi:hypothetical protein